MKNMIWFLLAFVFFASCAKDDGNYDYKQLNSITIDSIRDSYTADQFDTLKITPKLNFSLHETERLAFEWIIGEKVISTERNCCARLEMPPALSDLGKIQAYDAVLCVTDQENGLKYYKDFEVTVNVPYGKAMFLLSERADGTANLAYRRMDRPNAPIVDSIYETVNPDFGTLGTKPKQIFYSNFMKSVIVLCEEGDKRLTLLDPNYMTLKKWYMANSIVGGYEGEFAPEFIYMAREGVVVGGGEFFGFNFMQNQTLVLGAKGDWNLAPWAGTHEYYMAYLWLVYDNKYDQFLTLRNNGNGMSYNEVIPLTSEEFSTVGQEFLAAGALGSLGLPDKRIILYNANERQAYFYRINLNAKMDYNTGEINWNITYGKIMEQTDVVDQNSICLLAPKTRYWYLSKGNEVKKIFADGGEVTDFHLVENGNVVCMMVDAKEERLFLVAYDGSCSYLYTISMIKNTEKGIDVGDVLGEPLRIEGKVISMTGRDINKWTY